MLENLKQQNLFVRILIFYGLQFIYFNMRLSMSTANDIINHYRVLFFVIDIITFLIFSVYLIKTFQLPVKNSFFSWKTLGWLLLGLFSLLLYGNLLLWISHYLPPNTNGVYVSSLLNQFPIVGFFFNSIMAPVIEESIFRGVFFQLFFQKATRWRPFLLILVSALIFGTIHVQAGGFAWQNLLAYSVMGMVFGTIYYFNRKLKANILIHFIYNTAWQFAPFVFNLLWNFLM